KMRLVTEIKKLLQKEEQEIVGILQKFQNKILKKDKAVAEYLGIQHQKSIEEMELLEIDKSQNRANKVPNQVLREKDTLLQLECGTHDYGTREIQASKHKFKTRDLQEKIVRKNKTIHLIEREGPMDIEMLEKEEISPIIANDTNKVEQLQDKLQNLVIQEENKKSHSTKIDGLAHDKGRKNIYESR
ncbi:44491_t:CDS:2, partial [Gigaspora margarita]